jgi:formylglycine-generating enzyme required for sulfatase activity
MSRQRVLGAVVGVLLLVFALLYRFFPDALHVQHTGVAGGGEPETGGRGAMGFQRHNAPAQAPAPSAAEAGPPISLASSEVIMARRSSADSTPVSAQVADWLKRGDAAASAGQLVGGDDSAAAWYAKVLDTDADNRAARAGVAEVARRLASRADKALQQGDDDAAGKLLVQLRQIPHADAEAARIEHELAVQQQIAPMLAQAADLLKHGHDVEPEDANALSIYRAVIKLDADNAVAEQGLEQIQRGVLDRALAALAESDFPATDAALAQAAEILPDSQALQDTRSRVEGMRRRQAENVLAQARSALDGGNIDLAQTLVTKALAISPDLPGVDDFNVRLRNARLYASYRPGQVFRDRFLDRPGSTPWMVVVPTGSFSMGSADDGPAHPVTLGTGFAIGRTEVTVAEFREFIGATGYVTDAERLGNASIYDENSGRLRDIDGADWHDDYAGKPARDDDPVVNVSWNDAEAYVKWLAQRTGKRYRLASEAEFEYAMRGGTTTRYWWGDGTPDGTVENLTGSRDRSPSKRRWTHAFTGYGDGYWGPAPVMHFKPNPFGLYDIDGNVSEWVDDCWHDNYLRAPRDGSAWINPGCTARVLRGGSWGSAPEQVRSSYRQPAAANVRSARVGFRVVRVL